MSAMDVLNDAIHAAIDARLCDLHTCMPAQVEKYDFQKRKAEVKPLIRRPYLDGALKALPVLPAVPVVFPWGGDASLSFPLERGDTGMIFFSERSLEVWLARGGDADPGDPRKFDFKDAIFVPGLAPFSKSGPAEDAKSLLLKFGLIKLRMNSGKIAIGNAQAELLDIIDQLLTKLIGTVVPTAVGTYPISTAVSGEIAAIKVLLAFIKGTLQ